MSQTFLDKLLIHTASYESPGSFWKWAGYAAIAAVLKDNCYRAQGEGKLYPNIYVLLLTESGGRKGPPVEMAESLVFRVNNTKIISGRSSIQGIMDELARTETDAKTGKVNKSSAAILFAQEFVASIVGDPASIDILTDIYDYKSNPYKNRLRTGPCFNLEKVVFSMLTASNEDMLKGFFDVKAQKGGLLARTFLVVPNERRPANSFMYQDMDLKQRTYADMFGSFKEIAALRGEFVFSDEAKKEYDAWYKPFYEGYHKIRDSTGATARVHTGVLKVSMLLAANELSLNVERQHIEKAIEDCRGLLPNYGKLVMGNGRNPTSQVGSLILAEMFEAKDFTLPRKRILEEHWQDISGEDLDKLMVTLDQAGLIRTLVSGISTSFQLTEQGVKTLGGGK